MDYISQHKLISLVVLIVIIAAAWWGFTGVSGPSSVVTSSGTLTATSSQDAQIVSTLLQLQAVSLSGTILNDPDFLALQDFTTQIVTEPIGRPDPFAPLTGAPAATSTGALNPKLFAPAKH
ncbi:MAG TPA: hypothetical protein VG102_00790 [Candidatus Paceibacterota bacterium]|nr:hypothetical protein [Candidatus Paceibacterota bacterium]